MRSVLLFPIVIAVLASPVFGQNGFTYGDVIVSGSTSYFNEFGLEFTNANIQIHGRDGVKKRELIAINDQFLTEPLYRDGIVYVASRADAIERIDPAGNRLLPLTTQMSAVNFLSPGPNYSVFATNGSREIYQFAADGTLVRFRNFQQPPGAGAGIDLAPDQCTVFFPSGGFLARWDFCTDVPPARFGPKLSTASQAMRLLPDGTFLIAVTGLIPEGGNHVLHVDANGNRIRSYPIPAWALALDIDGKTFWTNLGQNLLRVDIESGDILSTTHTDSLIWGLSVVGEPRAGLAAAAAIPALSPGLLGLLALSLGAVALIRLRMV